MKQTLILSVCILLAFTVVRCKKNTTTPAKNLATCTTCPSEPVAHTPDSDTGLFYYLPTAFTPNGDGINDVFSMAYNDKVNVDSSTITIWDMKGNGVFIGTVNQRWAGLDLKGVKCAAGHYPFYLKLRTTSGQTITSCGCVTILVYKGTCIATSGYTYYLPDQLDLQQGFIYGTQDHLCP
jgi:gliding motility-associated-like protein